MLLTAGKTGRIDVRLVLKPDSFKKFSCSFLRLFCDLLDGFVGQLFAPCFFADINRGKHDVFKDGFVVEKVEVLEHHSHFLAVDVDVDLGIGDIDAVKDDTAACGVFHAVETPKKRTLARAGRTDDNDLFTFSDGGRDTL